MRKMSPYILKGHDERNELEVKYGNNFERNVFVKGDKFCPRAALRYSIASTFIVENDFVTEFGCSSGFGTELIPEAILYTGVDYDKPVIDLATKTYGSMSHRFIHADANEYLVTMEPQDVIIAFEFLEHFKNGKEFAQELKKHCKILLCTVPYNEVEGFWGEHHVIHNLTEKDFPGFEYYYISFEGQIIEKPEYEDGSNLMLMVWRAK